MPRLPSAGGRPKPDHHLHAIPDGHSREPRVAIVPKQCRRSSVLALQWKTGQLGDRQGRRRRQAPSSCQPTREERQFSDSLFFGVFDKWKSQRRPLARGFAIA
jgi:hypothetical protein